MQYEWVIFFIMIIIVYSYNMVNHGLNSDHKIIVLFTRNPISNGVDGFPFHPMYTCVFCISIRAKKKIKYNSQKNI